MIDVSDDGHIPRPLQELLWTQGSPGGFTETSHGLSDEASEEREP
jgi:hypothetical protein